MENKNLLSFKNMTKIKFWPELRHFILFILVNCQHCNGLSHSIKKCNFNVCFTEKKVSHRKTVLTVVYKGNFKIMSGDISVSPMIFHHSIIL